MSRRPIPVILDTDLGTDIDDSWALSMLLRCPELDLRLLTTCTQDTNYRARIAARMLMAADRSDVDLGVGVRQPAPPENMTLSGWVDNYDLRSYAGTLYLDGVEAMVREIMDSPDPMTLIAIGPLPNVAEALRREPGIAEKTHFVGMHGSMFKRHDGQEGAVPEYNVAEDVPAAKRVFAAPWKSITITPLDTCGQVILDGDRFRAVSTDMDPLQQTVIDSYQAWCAHLEKTWVDEGRSSVLYDTVAVHLAYSREYLQVERMNIVIDDEGYTRIADNGISMDVALDWLDRDGYADELVRRLHRPVVQPVGK